MGDQDEAVTTEAPVEGADSTRPESEPEVVVETPQEPTPTDDQQPTSSHENEEGGEIEGKKPSRLERRVDKLVSKLKEQTQSPTQEVISNVVGEQPLVTQEDYTNGLDPQVLEQRLEQRRFQDREQIKQELKIEAEYKQGVTEHLQDTEKVQEKLGDNPELDKLVAQQYEALNWLTDPRTGQTVFVPRVKMSEIYDNLSKVIEKSNVQAAADITGKIVQQAGEQAVSPSISNTPSDNSEDEALFNKAKSTGNVRDWAEVLKRKVKIPGQ